MMPPRTDDPAVIEHRLLDLAYTTDTQITAPVLAYYVPCSIEDAEQVLDRLVAENRLQLEFDDSGNIQYIVPNRQRVKPHREVTPALVLAHQRDLAITRTPNAGVAALLSLVVPGAGQLYTGRPLSAIAWFAIVTLGYVLLIIPGLMLHILCIASAASSAHQLRTGMV
jgi:TM2 domain-containing membrane protein YozV